MLFLVVLRQESLTVNVAAAHRRVIPACYMRERV